MSHTTGAPEASAVRAGPGAEAESVTATITIPRHAFVIVAPPPETLTQDNAFAVVGIKPRAFLRMLRAPGFPLPVTAAGKLRIVDRASFVAWLLARAVRPSARPPEAAPTTHEGVDAVLAEVGCRRVGEAKG